MHLIAELNKKGLLDPNRPKSALEQLQYLTILGSNAYGVNDDDSDIDVYGFCIPDKDIVFPHLGGVIHRFGDQGRKYKTYNDHHIKDVDKGIEYDITIYSIIDFFQLCMVCNPNMIDSLFAPRRCIIYTTQLGEYVRENRKIFLHKGAWHRFKGYSYSQLNMMKNKNAIGGRLELIEKYGYDVKFAYNVVRLLNEVEQIMIEHNLDLERNREQLKSIRRGEWTKEEVIEYFKKKENELETVYIDSDLQYSPNEKLIKKVLLNCLEMHFGSLDTVIKIHGDFDLLYSKIQRVMEEFTPSTIQGD